MAHPTYETLIDYVEHRLPDVEKARLKKHLASPCQRCATQIAHLRAIWEAAEGDRTSAPPADVLHQAVAAFQQRSASPSRTLLRVLAELQFDSRLQLSPMASRGIARTQQMLFATQQVDIDLHITPDHGYYNLIGQILDREDEDELYTAFVCLQHETGKLLSATEADRLGQFTFRQIPPGVYNLIIDLDNQEVTVDGLNIGNN